MAIDGRRVALAVVADDEVDLIRGMVELLRPYLDRVVIAEGRRTFHGEPREFLADGWASVLEIDRSNLRSVVVDLPSPAGSGMSAWQLGYHQRSAAALGLLDLDDEDLVVAVDSDEYVDPDWLATHAGQIESTMRLRMVPFFGGIDRRAPAWHCCLAHVRTEGQSASPDGWLIPGGVIGSFRALKGSSLGAWRRRPTSVSTGAAGWHLLHVLPPGGDPSRKYSRSEHLTPEGFTPEWVERMLGLGIHPAGWWAASSIDPPAALDFLRQRHPQVIRGPLPPEDERARAMEEALGRFGWDSFR